MSKNVSSEASLTLFFFFKPTPIIFDAEMKVVGNSIVRFFKISLWYWINSINQENLPIFWHLDVSQVMAGSSHKDFECITSGYPLRAYHVCYVDLNPAESHIPILWLSTRPHAQTYRRTDKHARTQEHTDWHARHLCTHAHRQCFIFYLFYFFTIFKWRRQGICSNCVFWTFHYENTPIQIYRKFHLQTLKISDKKLLKRFIYLLKNIDCGYSLEPPHRGGSNEYPQSMFLSRNKTK